MEPIQCLSSQAMGWVCGKRNPNGAEEGWGGEIKRNISLSQLGKGVAAEGAIALLTLAALVEACASAILCLITFCQCECYTEWLNSSAFTVVWGAKSLVTNIFKNDIWTRESIARLSVSEALLRKEDRGEINLICGTLRTQINQGISQESLPPLLTDWMQIQKAKLSDDRVADYFDPSEDNPHAL